MRYPLTNCQNCGVDLPETANEQAPERCPRCNRDIYGRTEPVKAVQRRDVYSRFDPDRRRVGVRDIYGKRIDGVVEARPCWQELVFLAPGGGPQVRKMAFILVDVLTGDLIDDRGRA